MTFGARLAISRPLAGFSPAEALQPLFNRLCIYGLLAYGIVRR